VRVLYDTSLIVAGLIESHTRHKEALKYLNRVSSNEYQVFVAAHSLAEVYATLTRLPPPLRVPPKQVHTLIQVNIIDVYEIIALEAQDYVTVLTHLATNGLVSGVIYDALILHAGIKASADRILTLNPCHFRLIYPEVADLIVDPIEDSAP
jgi:predicted nucleic acid-binding protein